MKVSATFEFENLLWSSNKNIVVGIDEVGRGAWAGPLVASAVVFPKNYQTTKKYFDSKMLNSTQREALAEIIATESISYGVGQASVSEINELGLTLATQTAYLRSIEALNCKPDHFLIDAFYIQTLEKSFQTPIVRGDSLCSSIAAASIIAKVYRDNLMRELGYSFPEYGLGQNKGYGTKIHQEAIKKHGLSPIHRVNYNLQILQ
jgi:ribonuclease HII